MYEDSQIQDVLDTIYREYKQTAEKPFFLARSGKINSDVEWAEKYYQGKKDGYRLAMAIMGNMLKIKPNGYIDIQSAIESSQGGLYSPEESLIESLKTAIRLLEESSMYSDDNQRLNKRIIEFLDYYHKVNEPKLKHWDDII